MQYRDNVDYNKYKFDTPSYTNSTNTTSLSAGYGPPSPTPLPEPSGASGGSGSGTSGDGTPPSDGRGSVGPISSSILNLL